jgi:hypothetical protein
MEDFLILLTCIAIFAVGAAVYSKYKEKHP